MEKLCVWREEEEDIQLFEKENGNGIDMTHSFSLKTRDWCLCIVGKYCMAGKSLSLEKWHIL